jgi:hypothetical protein
MLASNQIFNDLTGEQSILAEKLPTGGPEACFGAHSPTSLYPQRGSFAKKLGKLETVF